MKRILMLVIALMGLMLIKPDAGAQVTTTMVSVSVYYPYNDQTPQVPMEVALKRRKAITSYLLKQVDNVQLNYTGRSIVYSTQNRYMGSTELKNLGYIHPGSFYELTNALAGVTFAAQVIATPEGYYDLNCALTFSSIDGKILLKGNGNIPVWQNSDGSLSATTFTPNLFISDSILILTNGITGARWLGPNYEDSTLQIAYDSRWNPIGMYVSMYMLERGGSLLATTNYTGSMIGWNLNSGSFLKGKDLRSVLSNISSSDIRSSVTETNLSAGNSQFYVSDGQLYGRFPLVDVTVSNTFNVNTTFSVPVWGSKQGVSPYRVFVSPLYIKTPIQGGMVIGTEYEVPIGYIYTLQAGEYHIRCEFKDVKDWDADESDKG